MAAGLVLAAGTAGTVTGVPVAAAAPTPSPSASDGIDDQSVEKALGLLDDQIKDVMDRTGIPGAAVAVVHGDDVVYLKGFGVRSTGQTGQVDPDTVFQIASVSKPVSATVLAQVLGADGWDKPLTGITLKDPWVSEHVTAADLFSHRSGLPDHAGDMLEDLGFDQSYILSHLKYEPLGPFRASYAYTNFGLTAAAEAVARDQKTTWDKLAADTLYKPAGMEHTSNLFSDYEHATDRALTHVKQADGSWKPEFVRQPDLQSPAGGVSSTARDMARFLRLQLGLGELDGKRIINAEGLATTYVPHAISQPPATPDSSPGFYGLGWNVKYDDQGRLRLSHSGAFELGTNSSLTMLPAEKLGIVVLTNAAPIGAADTVAVNFLDSVEHGSPTRDWLPVIAKAYDEALSTAKSKTDYAKPPANPKPAKADDTYTGTYDNPYFGPLTVTKTTGGGLTLQLGPKKMSFPLTHYDGDVFSLRTTGEMAVGLTGVTFKDDTVRVESLDYSGLGTFTRAS
ncbi:serine hydrolase [Streptomyces sp. NPDC089919]|uniref:serine hydrolase n=1 Tax=Streptomyces sp. NPDC089919 TaxID=3155188 RepID=UPI00343199B0